LVQSVNEARAVAASGSQDGRSATGGRGRKLSSPVAAPLEDAAREDPSRWSHVRVATKYPEITRRHFASRGVQAECIKLNGAMELAPSLGLSRYIVDLVQTGSTMRANGLVEIEHIADVTSRLIVNRAALKTRPEEVGGWVERFREVADAA
jgi:ATP phosphoribosyltransferase